MLGLLFFCFFWGGFGALSLDFFPLQFALNAICCRPLCLYVYIYIYVLLLLLFIYFFFWGGGWHSRDLEEPPGCILGFSCVGLLRVSGCRVLGGWSLGYAGQFCFQAGLRDLGLGFRVQRLGFKFRVSFQSPTLSSFPLKEWRAGRAYQLPAHRRGTRRLPRHHGPHPLLQHRLRITAGALRHECPC